MNIIGKTAQEIFDCIRALVENGNLSPGDSLPPVRELAEALGINRNTVASAYQRLTKAGIAMTQGRLGTTICEPPHAGEQEGLSPGTTLIDLADGNPDPDWLPDVGKLLARHMPRPYLYGEETMLPALQQVGETWLLPDCPANGVLEVTHGAVDAIERLAVAHLVPGDRIVVEDPGFLGTINALRLAGMQAVGVGVDESGMLPEALQQALESGARAVLVTPRGQNPTGYSLSKRRAEAIKRILAAHPQVLVIVDDHFGLLATTPYHSIIPAAATRWALVRSVSKGLGPDIRVALLACDPGTSALLRTRLAPGMNWVSHILQAVVAAAMTDTEARARVEAAREAYGRQRADFSAALLKAGIKVASVSEGLNVWIPLARDEKDVAYAMAKKGWLVRPSTAFDIQGRSQALRVTVSKLHPGQAEQFAADLRQCLA